MTAIESGPSGEPKEDQLSRPTLLDAIPDGAMAALIAERQAAIETDGGPPEPFAPISEKI